MLNNSFLCLNRDLCREVIGDSVGGMLPPEPELKQSPRNSTCPGTGTFAFTSRTKEVFIYGIKDIFFLGVLRCAG